MKQTREVKDTQPSSPGGTTAGTAGGSSAPRGGPALRGMDYQSQVRELTPPPEPHRHAHHAPHPRRASHLHASPRGNQPQAPTSPTAVVPVAPAAQLPQSGASAQVPQNGASAQLPPGAATGGRPNVPDESVRVAPVVRANLQQALQSFETAGARALEARFAALGTPRAMAILRSAVIREVGTLSLERPNATVWVGAATSGEAHEMQQGGRLGTVGGERGFVGIVDLVMGPGGFVHVTTRPMDVGEHTLLIRLGRYSSEQRRRATAADTTLQTGALLTHLGELSGRR